MLFAGKNATRESSEFQNPSVLGRDRPLLKPELEKLIERDSRGVAGHVTQGRKSALLTAAIRTCSAFANQDSGRHDLSGVVRRSERQGSRPGRLATQCRTDCVDICGRARRVPQTEFSLGTLRDNFLFTVGNREGSAFFRVFALRLNWIWSSLEQCRSIAVDSKTLQQGFCRRSESASATAIVFEQGAGIDTNIPLRVRWDPKLIERDPARVFVEWCETYLRVPEGRLRAKVFRYPKVARTKFIRNVMKDEIQEAGTQSIARKNGKTGLLAAWALCFLAGPFAAHWPEWRGSRFVSLGCLPSKGISSGRSKDCGSEQLRGGDSGFIKTPTPGRIVGKIR